MFLLSVFTNLSITVTRYDIYSTVIIIFLSKTVSHQISSWLYATLFDTSQLLPQLMQRSGKTWVSLLYFCTDPCGCLSRCRSASLPRPKPATCRKNKEEILHNSILNVKLDWQKAKRDNDLKICTISHHWYNRHWKHASVKSYAALCITVHRVFQHGKCSFIWNLNLKPNFHSSVACTFLPIFYKLNQILGQTYNDASLFNSYKWHLH